MNHLNFAPFPFITTDRLVLRNLCLEDENEILFLRSDERILKYLDIPISKTVDDARNFIKKINDNIKNYYYEYY